MQKYRMEPFCPIFREVAKILDTLPRGVFRVYYQMLLKNDIKEVITRGQWVQGVVTTSLNHLIEQVGVNRGWFLSDTWPKLVEAKLVKQQGSQVIFLKYKKRKDQYLIPEGVKQQIQGLQEEVEALKTAIKSLASEQGSRTGNRSGSDRLPVQFRPVTGLPGHYIEDQKRSSPSIVDLVNMFYIGAVGHSRLTKKQRVGAQGYIKSLLTEFSREEVQQAIEWTIKNVEKLRSIKILDSTFHQALAVQETQKSKAKERVDNAKARDKEQEQYRKERAQAEKLEQIKKRMKLDDRGNLRLRAIEALAEAGEKPSIGWPEIMITLKENEIVRQGMEEKSDAAN